MRKERINAFRNGSKNLLLALLVVAAAVTVYGVAQAVVSHQGTEIIGPVAKATSAADSDRLQGLAAADILAQGGGGSSLPKVYKTDGTTLAGYLLTVAPSSACSGWAVADVNKGIHIINSNDCLTRKEVVHYQVPNCGDGGGTTHIDSPGVTFVSWDYSAVYQSAATGAGYCRISKRLTDGSCVPDESCPMGYAITQVYGRPYCSIGNQGGECVIKP